MAGISGENSKFRVPILCVDDREENLIALESIFYGPEYRLLLARSGKQALELLEEKPALVLLDVQMPVMDGFATARAIRANPLGKSIPIVFLTAIHRDESHLRKGFAAGGTDYLYKPIDPDFLLTKVRVFIDLYQKERSLTERAEELARTNSRLEAEIRKGEKLQADREHRARFVAQLVHDLRNPLSAAHMSLSMAIRRLDTIEKDQLQKTLERVSAAHGRINEMVETLLDAKRVEAGSPLPITLEKLDLCAFIQETVNDLNFFYGDRIRFNCSASVAGLFGGDPLRRAIENLVINAIKYGSESEPITVSLHEDVEGNCVEVAVHNYGVPISKDEEESIFEPYRRSLNSNEGVKGWGLGLSLVKAIAVAHGGSVRMESSSDRGTTFTMSLPLRDSKVESGRNGPSKAQNQSAVFH